MQGNKEVVLIINLTDGRVEKKPYPVEDKMVYGRLLALNLLQEYGDSGANRLDKGNSIVLVPGLFTGNPAPSAGRMLLVTQKAGNAGVQICNITGNMPEALGRNGIAAVVVRGKYGKENGIIRICGREVKIETLSGASGKDTGRIVRALRAVYGKNCAAIGIGPAGERELSVSSVFSTYADGYPEYYIPRGRFGDVFGAKGLRAVVVEEDNREGGFVMRSMVNPERFEILATELANRIRRNEICGNALPSYGAAVLQTGLYDRTVFGQFRDASVPEIQKMTEFDNIHRGCTPLCVIGCLNRHARRPRKIYANPLAIETGALIRRYFGIDNDELNFQIVKQSENLGISSAEYIESFRLYSECIGETVTEESIIGGLNEIEKDSPIGRILGSGAEGLRMLYPDRGNKTAAEAGDMPSEREKSLREQIVALDSLGFCIFTAFAIIDNPEVWNILAEMVEARLGDEWTEQMLMEQSRRSLQMEADFSRMQAEMKTQAEIPVFASVLEQYREMKKYYDGTKQ